MTDARAATARQFALWVVLLAAAGSYALTTGVRQSMGLFVSPLNTATGWASAASAWPLPSASCGGG